MPTGYEKLMKLKENKKMQTLLLDVAFQKASFDNDTDMQTKLLEILGTDLTRELEGAKLTDAQIKTLITRRKALQTEWKDLNVESRAVEDQYHQHYQWEVQGEQGGYYIEKKLKTPKDMYVRGAGQVTVNTQKIELSDEAAAAYIKNQARYRKRMTALDEKLNPDLYNAKKANSLPNRIKTVTERIGKILSKQETETAKIKSIKEKIVDETDKLALRYGIERPVPVEQRATDEDRKAASALREGVEIDREGKRQFARDAEGNVVRTEKHKEMTQRERQDNPEQAYEFSSVADPKPIPPGGSIPVATPTQLANIEKYKKGETVPFVQSFGEPLENQPAYKRSFGLNHPGSKVQPKVNLMNQNSKNQNPAGSQMSVGDDFIKMLKEYSDRLKPPPPYPFK
jgi:hypothetical protein